MTRGRDAVLAVLVGAAALVVYLRTLYPGLVGSGDTPELQFVGRVLGTPHTPGYPLYALLAHLFSLLPAGTPAWRANLMSAVFGALAAALAVLVLRRLGCRPAVAVAVALAMAFGSAFWSQATLAEVYTLAAALLLGTLLAVVVWAETRSAAALVAAFACAALGLAHHSSDVVTAAPGLAAFVLTTDARRALRPRMIAAGAACLAVGLGLYGFVLLRTHQGAPYLGSRARTVGELVDVMRGGGFASRLFVFDSRVLVTERVPAAGRLLLEEMGLAGVVLLAVGASVLVARRRREALLLLGAGAGPLGFALEYDVPDVAVFLIPAFVLLWPAAGVGLEALLARARRLPAALAAGLALLLPALQLRAHYRVNDHHDRTFEMRYFRAVFEALPERSAVVGESYTVDQMVRYELLGEGFAESKDVVLTGSDDESLEAYRRRGYALFAFGRGRDALAPRGFRLTPVTVWDAPLAAHLARAPEGAVVVLAGCPRDDAPAAAAMAEALHVLGVAVAPGGCVAAVGVPGRAGGIVKAGPDAATAAVGVGEAIGATGRPAPAALHAVARVAAGRVEVGGRTAAQAPAGVAVAVLDRRGVVVERLDLDAAGGLRVPFHRRAFPLYRVAPPECLEAGNRGWLDATPVTAGGRLVLRVDDVEAFDARVVLYLGGDRPLAPRLAETTGRGAPVLRETAFAAAAGRPDPALVRALEADGVPRDHPVARARHVSRVEVRVDDEGDFAAMTVDLGGVPEVAAVSARVDRDHPRRALVCGLPAGGVALLADPEAPEVRLALGRDASGVLGPGWHAPESDGPLVFRWTRGPEADLLLPLARIGSVRVRLVARAAAPGEVALVVNGFVAGARPLRAEWGICEWTVPPDAWRVGTNAVVLRSSGARASEPADPRALGVAVAGLQLRLEAR